MEVQCTKRVPHTPDPQVSDWNKYIFDFIQHRRNGNDFTIIRKFGCGTKNLLCNGFFGITHANIINEMKT